MRFSPGYDAPPPGAQAEAAMARTDQRIDEIRWLIHRNAERRAAKAQAEIHQMAESARRSIGQRVRHAKKAIKQARAGR